MEHGDGAGDAADELHVVLDHDQGVALVEFGDQVDQPVDLLVGHAGGRLVEQDQVGLGRDHHGELDELALAVRQLADDAMGDRR